jgi:hypothetical protein
MASVALHAISPTITLEISMSLPRSHLTFRWFAHLWPRTARTLLAIGVLMLALDGLLLERSLLHLLVLHPFLMLLLMLGIAIIGDDDHAGAADHAV